MLRPLIQFDSSTQKIIFDDTTKKVQTMVPTPCDYCAEYQPEEIRVSLKDFVDAGCCDSGQIPAVCFNPPYGPTYYSANFNDTAAYLNGVSINVPHSGGCIYEKIFEGNFGHTICPYPCSGCNTDCKCAELYPFHPNDYTQDELRIRIEQVDANTMRVRMWLYAWHLCGPPWCDPPQLWGHWWSLFDKTVTVSGDCFEYSFWINNGFSGCTAGGWCAMHPCGGSGKILVEVL